MNLVGKIGKQEQRVTNVLCLRIKYTSLDYSLGNKI